jgi:hypothetical protein
MRLRADNSRLIVAINTGRPNMFKSICFGPFFGKHQRHIERLEIDFILVLRLVSVHPEIDGQQLVPSIFSSSFRRAEILTAGIGVIFRGLKFPPNNEIGENSHLWMGTS